MKARWWLTPLPGLNADVLLAPYGNGGMAMVGVECSRNLHDCTPPFDENGCDHNYCDCIMIRGDKIAPAAPHTVWRVLRSRIRP